jgi:hypothetical protein
VAFTAAESSSTELDGVTVRAGNANSGGPSSDYGGGVLVAEGANPVLRQVIVENCRAAGGGGGIAVRGGAEATSATLVGVTVRSNTTDRHGAGLYAFTSSVNLDAAFVHDNIAVEYGGGVFAAEATLTIRSSIIERNSAGDGGGVYVVDLPGSGRPVLTLVGSHVRQNDAGDGGGLYLSDIDGSLDDSWVTDNLATGGSSAGGGGLFGSGIGQPGSGQAFVIRSSRFLRNAGGRCTGLRVGGGGAVVVVNSIFTNNTASDGPGSSACAVLSGASLTLVNSTLTCQPVGTDCGGAPGVQADGGTVEVLNSIFRGNNTVPGGGGTVVISHSLAAGVLMSGTENIDAVPLFVDADGADGIFGTADDDLTLQATSPALDQGLQSHLDAVAGDVGVISTDLAGRPRSVDLPGVGDSGQPVDLGCYERQTP